MIDWSPGYCDNAQKRPIAIKYVMAYRNTVFKAKRH